MLVFNGDILSGHDIAGQVQRWRDDSADVSLYLTRVEDPRAGEIAIPNVVPRLSDTPGKVEPHQNPYEMKEKEPQACGTEGKPEAVAPIRIFSPGPITIPRPRSS